MCLQLGPHIHKSICGLSSAEQSVESCRGRSSLDEPPCEGGAASELSGPSCGAPGLRKSCDICMLNVSELDEDEEEDEDEDEEEVVELVEFDFSHLSQLYLHPREVLQSHETQRASHLSQL